MDKLKGYKEGDRVRVTFDGWIKHLSSDDVTIRPLGEHHCFSLGIRTADFEAANLAIEKLPEPLKDGDRVEWDHVAPGKAVQVLEGVIITIYQDTAWVKAEYREIPLSVEIAKLTKIS